MQNILLFLFLKSLNGNVEGFRVTKKPFFLQACCYTLSVCTDIFVNGNGKISKKYPAIR